MTECINLREQFADRFRVHKEEGGKAAVFTDPWLMVIPCQFGEIYPHGGELLGFASNKVGGVVRRVAQLPYAEVTQEGDDGWNVTFPVDRFDEVAEIVKPKKRRKCHLSEEQLQRLAERGKQNLLTLHEQRTQATKTDPERDSTPAGGKSRRSPFEAKIAP